MLPIWERFDRDIFGRLYFKSLEAIFSKLKPYIYPITPCIKMYFSSFCILSCCTYVMKSSIIKPLANISHCIFSPVLYVHFD